MKIGTPSIRRMNLQVLFLCTCGALAALLATVVVRGDAPEERSVVETRSGPHGCGEIFSTTKVTAIATSRGIWRLQVGSNVQWHTPETVVGALRSAVVRSYDIGAVSVELGGEAEANAGEVLRVWKEVRDVPNGKVWINSLARSAVREP